MYTINGSDLVKNKTVRMMIFTRKLSPDEGFQVFKDELSHTHFQFIWGKISYKGNKATITHTL